MILDWEQTILKILKDLVKTKSHIPATGSKGVNNLTLIDEIAEHFIKIMMKI